MQCETESLWYRQPAARWNEALPIGNGKLAAMAWGGGVRETIQVDDSTFWSGCPSDDNDRPGTPQLVAQLRRLLLKGDYAAADALGHGLVGDKRNYGTHMPAGNLTLRLAGHGAEGGDAEALTRRLCLPTAVAETVFTAGGVRYKRTAFASHPAGVLVVDFAAESGAPFTLALRYDGIGNDIALTGMAGRDLLAAGHAYEDLHSDGRTGVALAGRLRLLGDGALSFADGEATLAGATRLTLLMALETTMTAADPAAVCAARVEAAAAAGYDTLLARHTEDFGRLYGRMALRLGGGDAPDLPTDRRIKAYGAGAEDPALAALAFQYGRYVLLCSSREDSPLPTHMGGIWNDNIYNRIDCTQDMHIDTNIQMQYWLAPMTALPECSAPLFRWLNSTLAPKGRRTAQVAYGARGIAAHVVSSPWGFTALGWAYNWGVWAYGAAWCATLMWDQYRYTGDAGFLRAEAWPFIYEAALFVLDYQFYDEGSGLWLTGPSYSPENMFRTKGRDYFLSLSTTCDTLLTREIFQNALDAAAALGLPEAGDLAEMRRRLAKMPPYKTGRHGQLQEWLEDFDEPIPGHRHTSHLLGLYPFNQISPEATPGLAAAARVSIARRYEDFEITSWGMVMLMSYFARLLDGDAAEEKLRDTFRRIVKPNLTSVMSDEASMWAGTWELDGNTGLTSAICELLVQSTMDSAHLLPALPAAWAEGEVRGIGLRGGRRVDLRWKNGRLEQAVLYADYDGPCALRYGEARAVAELKAGRPCVLDGRLQPAAGQASPT